MYQSLMCEKCHLIHNMDFNGLRCRDPECDGKLVPFRLWEEKELQYAKRIPVKAGKYERAGNCC